MCFRRLVVVVASDARYRNGSESRETMPLRKGASVGMCFRRLVRGRQSGCASEGLLSWSPRMRDTATAVNFGKWCRCGNEASVGMCFRRLVVGVASDTQYRNGSESREMVPLRKGASVGMCFRRLVVGVASDARYRNGSESRETMPLRKGASVGMCFRRLVNSGKRCRCGNGRQSGCASEGLWSGSPRICNTATAVNVGKCCHCGTVDCGTVEEKRSVNLSDGRVQSCLT